MRNTRTTHYTSPAAETIPLSPNYWGDRQARRGRICYQEWALWDNYFGIVGKALGGEGEGSSVLVKAVSFAFKGCYCCCLVVFFPEMM